MPLDVEKVPTVLVRRRMEEMVEAHFVESCRRGEARDMPAERWVDPVGLNHHRHGIPANEGFDPVFEDVVTRLRYLNRIRDRIDVGRGRTVRQMSAFPSSAPNETAHEKMRSFHTLSLENGIKCFEPLERFLRILVVRVSHRPLPISDSLAALYDRRILLVVFLRYRGHASAATMVSALRSHRANLSLEDINCASQRDLRFIVSLVRDQLSTFCLTADLRLSRAMLVMLAAFDVYHNMDQILLPLAKFFDP
jgi:hypothetical protein